MGNRVPDGDQITDVIGQNIESLLALFIGLSDRVDNFSVANEIQVFGESYRYQLVVGREDQEFYQQMEERFREAGLVGGE